MFRKLLAPAFCLALTAAPPTAPRSPVRVVEAQTEAFNAHDLEAFAGTFGEEVEAFEFPATPAGPKGRAALKDTYAKRFREAPDLHINVKEQMVSGAFVIQRERITGRSAGKEALELVVIYQVEGGLIRKFWTLR